MAEQDDASEPAPDATPAAMLTVLRDAHHALRRAAATLAALGTASIEPLRMTKPHCQ